MNAHDATLEIIGDSGMSVRKLSIAVGNTSSYLNRVIHKNGSPHVDKLAKLADICGYDLLLRRRDDDYEITIDPYDD